MKKIRKRLEKRKQSCATKNRKHSRSLRGLRTIILYQYCCHILSVWDNTTYFLDCLLILVLLPFVCLMCKCNFSWQHCSMILK